MFVNCWSLCFDPLRQRGCVLGLNSKTTGLIAMEDWVPVICRHLFFLCRPNRGNVFSRLNFLKLLANFFSLHSQNCHRLFPRTAF